MRNAELEVADVPYYLPPPIRGDGVPPKRPRTLEAVARDDDGRPVRLANYSRCCGTQVFAGFHDGDGIVWRTRFYESADPDAELLQKCPGCGSLLWREDEMGHRHPLIATAHEMDRARLQARERSCAGEAFDAQTFAALNGELAEGLTFDDAAALYGRTPDQLAAELQTWLDGKTPTQS